VISATLHSTIRADNLNGIEDAMAHSELRRADGRTSQMATKMAILTNELETETIGFLGKVHDSLAEMYDLLEKFSPDWYSEEVHKRAQSALALFRKPLASNHLNHLHQEKKSVQNEKRERALSATA
jgi:hypothetical protein